MPEGDQATPEEQQEAIAAAKKSAQSLPKDASAIADSSDVVQANEDMANAGDLSAVQLGDVTIYPDRPLPKYDRGPLKAYEARQGGNEERRYALITQRSLSPRLRAVGKYQSITNIHLPALVKSGVVFWPPAKEQIFTFIYEDKALRRVLEPKAKAALGMSPERMIDRVLQPLLPILQEFYNKDYVHGALIPQNMFWQTGDDGSEKILLGDSLSLPGSYDVPVLYETIERAMTSPIGRGVGIKSDDMYTLGVTLAVMLRSHDPFEPMSNEEIIQQKIEQGSFAAIVGKDRFKGSVLELLRGLLSDDDESRWDFEDITGWMEGRRVMPRQSVRYKKAQRPLVFNKNKYFYSANLARDIEKNTDELKKVIANDDLEQWVSRALEDEPMLERVNKAFQGVKEKHGNQPPGPVLASAMSTALDPYAPMRFKGMTFLAEGFGNALVETIVNQKNPAVFVELLSGGAVMSWLSMCYKASIDVGNMVKKIDSCRNFLRQEKIGFGLERCIYALALDTPCLSDKLKKYFVLDAESMLFAFEDMCANGDAPAFFMDRHTIAFLSLRDSKVVEPYMYDLSSDIEHRRILGDLRVLATMQKRTNLQPMPNIAAAIMESLSVVLQRFHDRDVRERLQKSLRKYAEKGELTKMLALISNEEIQRKDYQQFRGAMREYSNLRKESKNLRLGMKHKEHFGINTGKDVSAMVSSVLAILIMITLFAIFLSDGSRFF